MEMRGDLGNAAGNGDRTNCERSPERRVIPVAHGVSRGIVFKPSRILSSVAAIHHRVSLLLHGRFNFLSGVRQIPGDLHQIALLIDVVNILDAHSELLSRNVDSGFDGED